MRLVLLASGAFACPTLRWLHESGHDLALVLTQPARGSGRGRKTTRTPVHAKADELGIETLPVENVNDPAIVSRVQSLGLRVGVVIAFGQKLRPQFLSAAPGGFINLHASLLPLYRGAAPINWAIINGEQRTGCTVFRIVERMDAGPILITRSTAIKPEETAGELHDRLAGVGVDAVQAALALFEGDAVPQGEPQDHAQATSAPKLSKSDGLIHFDRPAAQVARHICGMTPWPGARSRYQSADGRWENVSITRARAVEAPVLGTGAVSFHSPGTIDGRLHVATADGGFVEILEIKPSSGRDMTWPEYVNGRHVAEGDVFVALSS